MNIKMKFVPRNAFDEYYLVPIDESAAKFNGLIQINEVSSYIFEVLPECETEEDIVDKVLEMYEVDRETAQKDISAFLNILRENEIID